MLAAMIAGFKKRKYIFSHYPRMALWQFLIGTAKACAVPFVFICEGYFMVGLLVAFHFSNAYLITAAVAAAELAAYVTILTILGWVALGITVLAMIYAFVTLPNRVHAAMLKKLNNNEPIPTNTATLDLSCKNDTFN